MWFDSLEVEEEGDYRGFPKNPQHMWGMISFLRLKMEFLHTKLLWINLGCFI